MGDRSTCEKLAPCDLGLQKHISKMTSATENSSTKCRFQPFWDLSLNWGDLTFQGGHFVEHAVQTSICSKKVVNDKMVSLCMCPVKSYVRQEIIVSVHLVLKLLADNGAHVFFLAPFW